MIISPIFLYKQIEFYAQVLHYYIYKSLHAQSICKEIHLHEGSSLCRKQI